MASLLDPHALTPLSYPQVLPTLRTGKFVPGLGVDRAGRPVCYYRVAKHDPRKFTPQVSGNLQPDPRTGSDD